MGSNLLDFKNWNHVSSDNKSTTLKHKKHGHLLTIAHNVLSKNDQQVLKSMAPKPHPEALKNEGQEAQTPSQSAELRSQKMADGGVPTASSDQPDENPNQAKHIKTEMDSPADEPKDSPLRIKTAFAPGGQIQMPRGLGDGNPLMNLANGGDVANRQEMNEIQVRPDSGYGKIIRILSEGGEVLHEMPCDERVMKALGGTIPGQNRTMYANGTEDATISQNDQVPPYLAANPPQQNDPNPPVVADDTPNKARDARSMGQAIGKAIITNPKVIAADEAAKGIGKVIQGIPDFVSGVFNPNAPADQSSQPSPQQQGFTQTPLQAQTDQTQPPAATPEQADPVTKAMQSSQNLLQNGFLDQMAGNKQKAEAEIQQARESQRYLNTNLAIQGRAQEAYQNQIGALNAEYQHIRQDIQDGHIDPEKYWTGDKDGNGSHSKIAAGLGMILAGFNPTNNPNAAINFLKFQMDKNLEAQSKNLDSQQNLLKANLSHYQNITDAYNATRIQQADILHNQMLMAANNAATPMAKAQMLQQAGMLEQQFAPIKQQFAMRQALMSFYNGTNGNDPTDTRAAEHMLNYMRATGMTDQAKDLESKLIPGVGMAKKTPPEEATKEMISRSQLSAAGQDLLNYSKTHTNLVPGTPAYNYGVTKALAFQQSVRDGLLGTVFRESEKPLLQKFVTENPAGAFKMLTTEPRLKSILDSNEIGLNELKKYYGIAIKPKQSGMSPQDAQALQWAQSHSNDPRAAIILKRLGR